MLRLRHMSATAVTAWLALGVLSLLAQLLAAAAALLSAAFTAAAQVGEGARVYVRTTPRSLKRDLAAGVT